MRPIVVNTRVLASAFIIAILVGAGAGYLVGVNNQRTTTSVSTVTHTVIVSEQSSTFSSPVAPTGLQLQIRLNATMIRAGGALTANAALFNTLPRNVSLSANFTGLGGFAGGGTRDFACGVNPVFNIFDLWLFRGHYTIANLSQAGPPLTLIAPIGWNCTSLAENLREIRMVEFRAENDSATLSWNLSSWCASCTSSNRTVSMQFGAATMTVALGATEHNTETIGENGIMTTRSGTITTQWSTFYTTTVVQPTWDSAYGSALMGYWSGACCFSPNEASNSTLSASIDTLYSNDFHPFSTGSYTIVAEDIWNQTDFAYFQVL